MNTWKLSEIEKEKAVQNIVRQGVVSPIDNIREVWNVSKVCSLRILFFGVEDCVFLGGLITICLWLFCLQLNMKTILCSVFSLSPFAYISCFAFTMWKEHLIQLYEVKMSCHFTIRQIIALRMLYLSLGNMLMNTLVLSLFVRTQTTVITFWKTLGLSFASLFLYGLFMLFFQLKGRRYLSVALPSILWIVCNLCLTIWYGERIEKLFLNLADLLVVMIVGCLFVAYLCMLYCFFTRRDKEEMGNAIG